MAKSTPQRTFPHPRPPRYLDALTVGWAEWITLAVAEPDASLPPLKVKVDTGARTSSLHAETIEVVEHEGGERMVRFALALPHRPAKGVVPQRYTLLAPLVGERHVRSSNGVIQTRTTVRLTLTLGGRTWEADVTLSKRRDLRFPMLLGRSAMQRAHLVVDPSSRYLLGAPDG